MFILSLRKFQTCAGNTTDIVQSKYQFLVQHLGMRGQNL